MTGIGRSTRCDDVASIAHWTRFYTSSDKIKEDSLGLQRSLGVNYVDPGIDDLEFRWDSQGGDAASKVPRIICVLQAFVET